MSATTHSVPTEIAEFCRQCGEDLARIESEAACIEYTREQLPRLLLDKGLFTNLLEDALSGGGYPDIKRPTMFDNELLLHMDGKGVFSLRMYLWGPGEFTVPHDHSSWGVIGSLSDGYEVINYSREDDGTREGYARIAPTERLILKAGETAFTHPFDAGIHKTGNPTTGTIISLNMYGRPAPRGFICGFDVEHDRVYKILPPRRKKEVLLRDALRLLKA